MGAVKEKGDAELPNLIEKEAGVKFGVPVRNGFEVLMSQRPNSTYRPERVKQSRTPPITVPRMGEGTPDFNLVRSAIQEVTSDYQIRFLPSGMKILPNHKQAHELITTMLSENLTNYFTHPYEENKPQRYVLYGLDRYELDEVKEMFKKTGLDPTDVKYMFLKQPKFQEQCNYIVYFDRKSNVTIDQLKSIKAVNHVIVSWDHYKRKTGGVTCCRKCLGFGHGSQCCGLPAKCLVCAKPHLVRNCPLIIGKRTGGHSQIHQDLILCGNCGANHTATYKDCPTRLNYIEGLSKNRKPTPNQPKAARSAPPPSNPTNFPTPIFASPAYTSQQTGPSYASIANQKLQNPQQQQSQTEELYTMSECKTMLDNLFGALQACNSRQQQAKVIADYALQYLCNFP